MVDAAQNPAGGDEQAPRRRGPSRLWRFVPAVRREERERFLFFAFLLGGLSLAQTAGLAGAEALLLGRRGPEILPLAFIVGALATIAGSLVYAGLVGASRNDVLFVRMLVLSAALLLGGAVAAGLRGPGSAIALFAAWFVAQAVLLSHFWTFASDHFDTLASKRVFPLFGVGSSIGGALGGALAAGLALTGLPELLIVAWAVGLAAVAITLQRAHTRLLRWGPMAFEEADETSFRALAAAARVMRISPIARALGLSALAMMMALFLGQYLYSAIFVERFPSAETLAGFFGLLALVTNLLEIAVEVAITPWLIRRFGLANANLVHPATTVGVFAALAAEPGLTAAVAARVNGETLENALSDPVRNLVYNALPPRLRGRMRALLEGIVVYTGMAIAGGLLLAFPAVELRTLCGIGGGLAVLYLVANLGVRRAYLQALVQQLRTGRLDLDDLGTGLGASELHSLAELWRGLLAQDLLRAGSLLELAPLLAERGAHEPLYEALDHEDARVRAAAASALAAVDEPRARRAVRDSLEDPEASVRQAVTAALVKGAGRDVRLTGALRERLRDPDPTVRAAAAAALGPTAGAELVELARSADREEAVAALGRLPHEHRSLARARALDPDPAVRCAALEALARLNAVKEVGLDALEASVRHPHPAVREAAVVALGAQPDSQACAVLGEALGDAAHGVRAAAAAGLGRAGGIGMPVVLGRLDDERSEAVAAALDALGAWGSEPAKRALLDAFRNHVLALWEHLLAVHALAGEGDPLLRAAHVDGVARHGLLAFRALGLAEGEALVASIQRALQLGPEAARTEAIEVLSNLGEREAAGLLALASETGALEDRIRGDARFAARPQTPEDVLAAAADSGDRWVRRAARAVAADAENSERETMEKLLALRRVPLFGRLSLDQLDAIGRVMTEAAYSPGEVIFREGEPGRDLYLLLEGEVEIWKDFGAAAAERRNRIQAVGYFGEMAVLDDAPRSASVLVTRDARVSVLGGDRLKELVLQMPDIAFDLFRELSRRLRSAESALGERRESKAPEPASA